MKFTVSEVARILEMNKDLVKTWAFKFSGYLNPKANPAKAKPREFNVDDIRVLAYISLHWDEDPDIEYIKTGLNSASHYEDERIKTLMIEITPIFSDPPENIDETWKHGVLFSGLAQFGDTFYLANSYKYAGDKLIETALKNKEPQDLFCPAIYTYRHATELYLKAITGHYEDRHDLISLYNKFQTFLKVNFTETAPDWFKNIVLAFNDFDPGGTTFRYGGKIDSDEIFVDFRQLKTLMGWLARVFQKIRMHQGLPDAVL